MDSTLPAVHPGEILREEYLVPLDISARQLAKTLLVADEIIDGLVNETVPVSVELAFKLAKYFRTSPELWMHAQATYDLRMGYPELADQLAAIGEFKKLDHVTNAKADLS